MMKPFEGIRVLDLTRMVAGPFCTSLLGDFGAEVIKIEQPGVGDDTRYYDDVFPGEDSSYFLGVNRSKKSMTVNLKDSRGIEIVKQLAKQSDVLIESNRAGVTDRLGLGYEEIKKLNPNIIYCSISAFGSEGPLRDKPGMDIVVQAISGVMSLTGEPGRTPVKMGSPIVDFISAYTAFSGISMALYTRERTGIGQKIEISLLDGMISAFANYFSGFFQTGKPDQPFASGHPQIVPYQAFEAKNRQYIVVGCLTEEFWKRFAKGIGLSELIEDPRFKMNLNRVQNREELVRLISKQMITKSVDEWTEIFDALDIPNAPVNNLEQSLNHPQVIRNEMVIELQHPKVGKIKVPGIPIKLSETPGRVKNPPPLLGEHTGEILEWLGYSNDKVETLKNESVI